MEVRESDWIESWHYLSIKGFLEEINKKQEQIISSYFNIETLFICEVINYTQNILK